MPCSCHNCGQDLSTSIIQGRMSFKEECPKCGSDAHVCLNCSFYDQTAYRECRESQAEWVKEKDERNICEYFRPKEGNGAAKSDKASLLSKLDDLFKK